MRSVSVLAVPGLMAPACGGGSSDDAGSAETRLADVADTPDAPASDQPEPIPDPELEPAATTTATPAWFDGENSTHLVTQWSRIWHHPLGTGSTNVSRWDRGLAV
jgi:hypothetical protein